MGAMYVVIFKTIGYIFLQVLLVIMAIGCLLMFCRTAILAIKNKRGRHHHHHHTDEEVASHRAEEGAFGGRYFTFMSGNNEFDVHFYGTATDTDDNLPYSIANAEQQIAEAEMRKRQPVFVS